MSRVFLLGVISFAVLFLIVSGLPPEMLSVHQALSYTSS